MKLLNPKIRQKFAESLKAVLPVVGIVIVLSFTIAPITSSILLCFLVGAVMVMAGDPHGRKSGCQNDPE